ncbi:hypothetical protein [Azonexus sp.]|uniref:hypothetical protein n=1 Tax=Azonexus sp. TaxID=1872668 RepID=UPI0035B26E33
MIGAISHVDGMKERIAAQIRVEKGGGIGYSRRHLAGNPAWFRIVVTATRQSGTGTFGHPAATFTDR